MMIEALLLLLILLMPSLARLGDTGIIHQVGPIQDVSLGTLAAKTAIAGDLAFTATTAGWLMKQARQFVTVNGVTIGEGPILIGIARGDATAAEISLAMIEANTSGPQDTTQRRTESDSWIVLQNSVEQLIPNGDGTSHTSSGKWISFGKGIPYAETSGWQSFIYNASGSALTTGARADGDVHYRGVWLGS